MVTEKKVSRNFGSEANESRKKRGAKVIEEVDQAAKTSKRQKLDRDLFLSGQCFEVLRGISEHRFGRGFNDMFGNIPADYFSVISKPMDFLTIKSKLAMKLYRRTEDEFPEDVRLVLANAMRYYPPENQVHKNARELQKIFETRWESVKKKLACEFPETQVDCLRQRQPEKTPSQVSSSSVSLYVKEKVSLSATPVREQGESDQYSNGFVVPTPLSHEKALRAATIKIRFADTIVKAKYKKLIDESCKKADVVTMIEKERQLLEKRQLEEKARIEAEIKAPGLKLRHEVLLGIKKREEEANPEDDDKVAEKELVKLCGGSKLARTRWFEHFGLVLKSDDDGLDESEILACEGCEEGEII